MQDRWTIGDGQIGSGLTVAVTRVVFHSPMTAFTALRRFRRLYRQGRATPGLLRGQVALAGPRTLLNVSLWASPREMLLWSGTPEHVAAVQWTYGRTVEVWSGFAPFVQRSPSAKLWDGQLDHL